MHYKGLEGMLMRAAVGAALAVALLTSVNAANAAVVGLTNTGVDVGAGEIDNAWSIVGGGSDPSLTYASQVYADTTNGTFPIGPWAPDSSVSNWDTPFNELNQQTDPSMNGSYVYQTQFTVTSTLAATNSLALQFAADNEVAWISLNGQQFYIGPTDGTTSQFTSFTSAVAQDLLILGVNTLQVDVINYAQDGGNPSGLDLRFTSVSGVPELSTWVMLLVGFAGLGFAGYRGARKEGALPA